MSYPADHRVEDAKQIRIQEVLDRLGVSGLRRTGSELVGPCPLCGGRDRFGINLQSQAFLCRQCDIRGGDQIALVMSILRKSFPEALTWLCGDAKSEIDPKVQAQRRFQADEAARKREQEAERYRKWAINAAREIWHQTVYSNDGIVRAYLAKRGFTRALLPTIPPALHECADLSYTKKTAGKVVEMYKGPAMVAAIQHADLRARAVHRTWVDLDQPNGKALICWEGEVQNAKLVWGSKKGGSIRLLTPEHANALVMGEGIETTLSAMVAQPVPGAAYWAGVDLGNMSGRMKGRNSGIPDLTDEEAFVPPTWVKQLIFIMDGDSEPKMTRAKLECGLRRAKQLRPGIECKIVPMPKGIDLNDMLVEATDEHAV